MVDVTVDVAELVTEELGVDVAVVVVVVVVLDDPVYVDVVDVGVVVGVVVNVSPLSQCVNPTKHSSVALVIKSPQTNVSMSWHGPDVSPAHRLQFTCVVIVVDAVVVAEVAVLVAVEV